MSLSGPEELLLSDKATNAITIGYRLYTVVPRLLNMIDDLTNWYIRFNRRRLKGAAGLGVDDTAAALNTLLLVLFTMIRALAPFTPFVTEHIYGLLKPFLGDVLSEFQDTRSVHFLSFPTAQDALFDEVIERQMAAMQKVIQLGRMARERKNTSLKTPLLTMVVVADEQMLSDVASLKSYIQEELNIRNVVLTTDEEKYGISLEAKVDWPTLGKKLKKDVQVVRKALPGLTQEQLRSYQHDKKITIQGIELDENDLTIVRVLAEGRATNGDGEVQWEPSFAEDAAVLLDTTPHPELADEGMARELINRVQRLRKKAGLVPTDDVHMQYRLLSNPEEIEVDSIIEDKKDLFAGALRGTLEKASDAMDGVILEEEHRVGDLVLTLRLLKVQA